MSPRARSVRIEWCSALGRPSYWFAECSIPSYPSVFPRNERSSVRAGLDGVLGDANPRESFVEAVDDEAVLCQSSDREDPQNLSGGGADDELAAVLGELVVRVDEH